MTRGCHFPGWGPGPQEGSLRPPAVFLRRFLEAQRHRSPPCPPAALPRSCIIVPQELCPLLPPCCSKGLMPAELGHACQAGAPGQSSLRPARHRRAGVLCVASDSPVAAHSLPTAAGAVTCHPRSSGHRYCPWTRPSPHGWAAPFPRPCIPPPQRTGRPTNPTATSILPPPPRPARPSSRKLLSSSPLGVCRPVPSVLPFIVLSPFHLFSGE